MTETFFLDVVEVSCHLMYRLAVFNCRMLIPEPCKIPILLGSCRYLVLIQNPRAVTKAVMETSLLFVDFFESMYLRCAKKL